MATIVNKTIWTNTDWTPIIRKARMMAIPKEWDRATSPNVNWPFHRMYNEPWDKATEPQYVPADKFKPVGYQNNGNKVYKNSKWQQFSLDSNWNAYLVNEKPVKQTNLNTLFKGSTSMEDFATKMADQNPDFKEQAMSMITKKINDITDIYKIKNWEQFMTPMRPEDMQSKMRPEDMQSKYPSYQELTKPMFDNTTITPASNWFTDFTAWVLDTVTAMPTVAWKAIWRWVWAVAKMNPYVDDATVDKYVKSRESELDKNRSNYMWEQRWWAFTAWQVTAWVIPLVAWWMWSVQVIPKMIPKAIPFQAPNIPYTFQSLPSPISFAKLIRWY